MKRSLFRVPSERHLDRLESTSLDAPSNHEAGVILAGGADLGSASFASDVGSK
jgi:hypothetical protein